jgi:hypothetical protein
MTAAATKVRYDGSACLNVRSVSSACSLLTSNPSSEKPLRWADLASVLWFVETAVTSKKLFFDGTVPRDSVERALQEVEGLKRNHDLKLFEVAAITFDQPERTLAAAGNALAESRLLLEHFALDPGIDTALDVVEHENFVQQLGMARALPEIDRKELALTWVTDAFRGSKCLAGLIAAGDTALNSAYALYQKHGDQGPTVTSALINRFRLNYVNQLASQKQSAYVPDPAFETLTKEHLRLFKDYLIDRIVKKLQPSPDEPNILVENMKAETPLPPIGLYALMATRAAKYPAGILETAYNEFRQDEGLMRVIWQNTKGGIALKKQQPGDAYASEIEHYFYDHYKTLEKEAEGIKVLSSKSRTARTYLVPAVLKGLAKAIPDVVGAGGILKVLYSVLRETGVETSIPFLSDRLLGEGCDSYISQYKSLKWDLQHDDSIKAPLAKLSDQVERVFGRKLM